MKLKEKKRIDYIDLYRGFGIVIMVMGHVGFGAEFDYWCHGFHMPMWFIVSGYFFNKEIKFKELVKKKTKQLIIPYVSFGLFYYLIWLVLKRDALLFNPVLNLLFINTSGLPISGVIWFLTCLFCMEIICFFIFKMKTTARILIVLTLVTLVYIINVFLEFRLPWALDTAIISIPFFMFGYYLNEKNKCKYIKYFPKLKSFNIFFSILGLVVGSILIFINSYVNLRTAHYGMIILFYLDALLVSISVWNISRIIDSIQDSKILLPIINYIKKLGRYSLVYLCTNQFIIMILNTLLQKYCFQQIDNFILSIIVFALTLFFEEIMVILFTHTILRKIIGK